VLVIGLLTVPTAEARPMPPGWHAPRAWLADAVCIHSHEGAWDSIGYVRGVPTYAGGMQFLVSTWRAAGGRETSLAAIAAAPIREQLYRAWITWRRDGGSWREWGTAGRCGLR
jgi:hypothetical protein